MIISVNYTDYNRIQYNIRNRNFLSNQLCSAPGLCSKMVSKNTDDKRVENLMNVCITEKQ